MAIGASIARTSVLVILILCALLAPPSLSAQYVLNPYDWFDNQTVHTSFGNMNALGIGTPTVTGVTVIPLTDGALYYRQYTITITGLSGSQTASLSTYVYDSFGHPNALILRHCPSGSSCTSAGNYVNTPARRQDALPLATNVRNGTYTVGMAVFVPDNNGASAYTGSDNAQVRVMATVTGYPTVLSSTLTFALDSPNEVVQNALRCTFSPVTGGLPINPGPPSDYRMNFGNVNGLGIGPGAGLTTTGVAGGVIYSTGYQITTAFTGFASTTGRVSTYVSTDFAHPAILSLQHATNSGGPFTAISKSSGTPTSVNNSAQNRASFTRYLGLFVSNANGPSAFTGTDSATLTFILTVP